MDAQRSIVIGPMGVGELVDRGLTLARRRFRYLAGIGAWGVVLSNLLYVLFSLPTMFAEAGGGASDADFATTGVGLLLSSVCYVLASTAIAIACAGLVDPASAATPVTTDAAYRQAAQRFLPLLGLLMLFGLVLIPFAIVLPLGIYVLVRGAAVANAVIIDGFGPWPALRRSWELTRNAWWHTALVLALGGLAISLLEMAPSLLLTVAAEETGLAMQAPLLASVLQALVSSLFSIVLMPFYIAVGVVLYYELRARAEGFDLERRLLQTALAE
jgi:hypothetical protein